MSNPNFFTEENEVEEIINPEQIVDEANELSSLTLTNNDIFRIEENQTKRFSGVRSCSKPAVHSSNANQALQSWVKQKLYEYRNLRYVRYGHLGGTARWRNRTSWDGRRSCTGSVTVKCYIEFRKP